MLLQCDDKQHLHISSLWHACAKSMFGFILVGNSSKKMFMCFCFNMKAYGLGNVKFNCLPGNYGTENQNTQKSAPYTKS